ncbi:ABC transporter permease [Clostridium omnivorum]|uniref:ABC transporter permease n=1 Tax=Clostridium omnivorum TaxID=1604902 RepID=A0ABQ5N1V5_9CLOT|nr:ABC transporter permease subunit [Clostridium sp. E14]GLC29177.1 ABC transporter permease [Clostridium sp. E14]
MRSYIAFTKKEWMDYLRNYKAMILIIVFAILGIMSPLSAKFMPDILKEFMPAGMSIQLPEPSNIDSWTQFFKNVSQMGSIVMVIIFSGMMSNEYEKGTLVNLVTKGLSRKSIIAAKYTIALVLWTISYWVCFFITWAYTLYYFPEGKTTNLTLAVFGFYLFGIMLILIVTLGAISFKNTYGSLLFTAIFTAVLFIINLFPKAVKWNPLQLASSNMKILQGALTFSDIRNSIIILIIITLCSLGLSIVIFNKKLL